MWVSDVFLNLIVNNGRQKNIISVKVVKKLKLSKTPHPQPYDIGWLDHGQDPCVSQQWCIPYAINPSKDEVLCDIDPLEVSNVLLGQPYMWQHHDLYESRPHSVIITLGKLLYRILEVGPKASTSLILANQCRKVINQIGKFVLFMVLSQSEKKIVATSMTYA